MPAAARRRPRSRRSAGPARRARCAAPPSARSGLRACAGRRPRTRADRRGTWGRSAPLLTRRPRDRRGRCAAGRARRTWATRSAGRGRRRPCRSRAPASWWRPDTAAARLQQLLDLGALLARERAVVGAGDLLAGLAGGVVAVLAGGELVQAQRHPLGGAAVVDEDDRRVVLAHLRQQLRVDRRPDRVSRGLAACKGLQRIGCASAREARRRRR